MNPTSPPNDEKLRVAFTKERNSATFTNEDATEAATNNATPTLKALALKVLERNKQRNPSATARKIQRNFTPLNTPSKLRRVAPSNDPVEVTPTIRVYQYQLTDNPNIWLTMITPGANLKAATHALHIKFGEKRVIGVKEREPSGAML